MKDVESYMRRMERKESKEYKLNKSRKMLRLDKFEAKARNKKGK